MLHLTGKGDAIAMCVFENRQQDVKVTLAGEGEQRTVTGSEIGFEGKKIWVALLEGPHIWHTRDTQIAEAGKVMPLDWKMPFPAQWRVDFTRTNDLTDSWEMLLQEQEGRRYTQAVLARQRGRQAFPQPQSLEHGARRYPLPLLVGPEAAEGICSRSRTRCLRFQGPVVIYPINRVKQTPLDAYTVVDVMRNTLGVGPCEHILDLEGQKAEYKGRATCRGARQARRRFTRRINRRATRRGRQDSRRWADVRQAHPRPDHPLCRVRPQDARLPAEQKKAHPELAEFIAEMDKLTRGDRQPGGRARRQDQDAGQRRQHE